MFPSIESKISDHLRTAEERLEAKGYAVVRLVRNSNVFALEIYGETFHQLRMAHAIVGEGYKLLLNAEGQQILIQ
jgi:hypothetical protein